MSDTYIPRTLRERVATAAQHLCGYCHTDERIVGTPLELDHLIPESQGGKTIEFNLWGACSPCNDHKSSRMLAVDPLTNELVRIFNPRAQAWKTHFKWSEAGDIIIGLTQIGRATISALKLNRTVLVLARRRWVSAGWHPPADDRD